MHEKKIYIVIPAHNEEKTLRSVLKDLKSHSYRNIIVVDDGSHDRTYDIAESGGAHALRHLINRGQGAAIKTGIDYAIKNGAEIIVTFDADGQHLAKDLKALILPVSEGKADITVGSRFLKQSTQEHMPFIRRTFLQAGALLFRLLYGLALTDSHNGLRAISAKAASMMNITSDGMGHATEIVEIIAKNKLRFIEVPVEIPYTDYAKAHSHQGSFAGFKILFDIIRKKIVK